LYMNRPTVEPELFASLRPPTYGGTIGGDRGEVTRVKAEKELEKSLSEISKKMGLINRSGLAADFAILGGGENGAIAESKLRILADRWGSMPERERVRELAELKRELPARYRAVLDDYFRAVSDGEGAKREAARFMEAARQHLRGDLDLGRSVASV